MDAGCWCEYVDIGVGMIKVAHNPDCPECNDPAWFEEPPMTTEEEEVSGAAADRR